MPALKVFLVDSSEINRRGLALLINSFYGMQVVASCAEVSVALPSIKELQPDVVIIDGELPKNGAVQLLLELKQNRISANSLVLARTFDALLFRKLMQNKNKGFLLKSSSAELLATAIRALAAGKVYLDPTVVSECLDQVFTLDDKNYDTRVKKLSPNEETVLKLWVRGVPMREIAAKLDRSAKTMDTMRVRAYAKLGLRTRADAINYALKAGWLTPTDSSEI